MKQSNEPNILKFYCTQISKYKLLTKEEEVILLRKSVVGDNEAIKTLTNCNIRFVIKLALQYSNSNVTVLDLVSEGNIGLMRAAAGFEASKIGKIRFLSYAVWWIRKKILDYIHETSRSVITSNEVELTLHKIHKLGIRPRVGIGGNFYLDSEDINKAVGKRNKEQILELNRVYKGDLYFEDKISDEGVLGDFIPDKKDLQDIQYESGEVREKLNTHLDILTKKEKRIISEYYGLGEGNIPKTLLELSYLLGISRERVRQIKKIALKKLKYSSEIKELLTY
jgi:RNA polymerase primary sigma factor